MTPTKSPLELLLQSIGLTIEETAKPTFGKWSLAGVPHSGWRCVGIEELEDRDHLCDMCERQYCRFVHVMEHDQHPDQLRVGCVCAGHMEGDVPQAVQRESQFRNEALRRRNWLTRKWRASAKGNTFLNADGFHTVIYPVGPGWGAKLTHRRSGHSRSSTVLYAGSDEAKLAAFDLMQHWRRTKPWK